MKLNPLVRQFAEVGTAVRDPAVIRGLTTAFAQLSQEEKYMDILIQQSLLSPLLDQLLRNASIFSVKEDESSIESCSIAICRVASKLNSQVSEAHKALIATTFSRFILTEEIHVLISITSSIRALLERKICFIELLSSALISRIGVILSQFLSPEAAAVAVSTSASADSKDAVVQLNQMCCAILALLSYSSKSHSSLSESNLVKVLFSMTYMDDSVTRELAALTLCNVSYTSSDRLIEEGKRQDITC
jgi:hypothetical protein